MYKFSKLKDPENPYDDLSVSVETSTVDLTELIDAFKSFLKLSGFVLTDKSRMTINQKELLEAIEGIDGGCGPCQSTFLEQIKKGTQVKEFNALIDALIKRDNTHFSKKELEAYK